MMGVALLLPTFLHRFVKYVNKKQDDYLTNALLPVLEKRRKLGRIPNQIDVLQDFIEAGFSNTYIVSSVKTTMWAAVMNTAASFSHVLNDIYYRPNILSKVRKEIDSFPEIQALEYSDLEKMEYLEACIKESLRMASAPFGAARFAVENLKAPNSDTTVPSNSPGI
jgi:cytochrome P450